MKIESFDELLEEVRSDREARTAGRENAWRRGIAEAFDEARMEKGLSIRGLATEMSTSISQVQRLLHRSVSGSLTLRTVCRAADALDLKVSTHVWPRAAETCKIVRLGSVSSDNWERAGATGRTSTVWKGKVNRSSSEGCWVRVSDLPKGPDDASGTENGETIRDEAEAV